MTLIRAIISAVREGINKIQRFDAAGRKNETFLNREYLQHYGFTSRPLSGAEGIVLLQKNAIYMIATDDRRYRISLQDGEVAIYTDEGDFVHFRRNMEIRVNTGNKLIIDAASKVDINAPDVTINCTNATINSTATTINTDTASVNAAASADITSPDVSINSASSMKTISPVVQLGQSAGHKALMNEDLLTLYNSHTHPESGGGTTGVPNQQAGSGHKTSNVKAT